MKANELQEKNIDELKALKEELLKELFNLLMQKGSGQASKTHLFGEARRNIARIETVINQKAGAA